jgi:hypothetical protein
MKIMKLVRSTLTAGVFSISFIEFKLYCISPLFILPYTSYQQLEQDDEGGKDEQKSVKKNIL